MRFKTTAWLLVWVVLLGGVIWVMNARVDSTDQRQDVRVMDMDYASVHRIEITTDEFSAVVVREDGVWRVDQPVRARANEARVGRLLAATESMRRMERITPDQRAARELSLDDYGLDTPRAKLVIENSLERHVLLLGGEAPLGEHVYVKLAASDDVLATEASLVEAIPAKMDDLRDRSVLIGDPYGVSRLEIQWVDGGFTQLARTDGGWMIQQPFQAPANNAKVAAILDVLFAARIQEFVWDGIRTGTTDVPVRDRGRDPLEVRAEELRLLADEAVVRIGVWTKDGEPGTELLLGKTVPGDEELPSGQVYARFGAGTSIFTVRSEVRDAFAVVATDLRDKNLFPRMSLSDVGRIQIEAGDRRVVLHKSPQQEWMITEPVSWRADAELVTQFLHRATRLRADTFLDAPATNLEAMGLAPPRLKLNLAGAEESRGDGASRDTGNGLAEEPGRRPGNPLWIGGADAAGDYLYARFEEEAIVFTVPRDAVGAWGAHLADPLFFRDRMMLSLDAANIKRISIEMDATAQSVTRSDDGEWRAEGAGGTNNAVNRRVVDQILFHVSRLRAERIESHDPDDLEVYGLTRDAAVLTLGLSGSGGIQKILRMGSAAGTDGVYAMVQGQDAVFVLAEDAFRALTMDLVRLAAEESPATAEGGT